MAEKANWLFQLFLFTLLTAITDAFTGCYHGSVRLNSGASYYGRVEVCIAGEWGTVCRSGWDNNDAAVVCRQLGYQTTGATTYMYPSSGDGAIYMNNVNCRGTELSLFQCDYQSLIGDYSPCYHGYDAGVSCTTSACTNGQVRLTGGDVSTEGNVEICDGGMWTGVCSQVFNYRAAMVVCAQLGLPSTAAVSNSYRYVRYPVIPMYQYGFNCYGYESTLVGCASACCYSCDLSSRAGAICRGKVVEQVTGPCSGLGLRLVNGSNWNEGRVEVCSNGVWGTINGGSSWDSSEGQVACRQLGFQNPAVFIYADNNFGAGTAPVIYKHLSCNGNELYLSTCTTSNVNYNDQNSAGLRCENYPNNDGCQPGSVRLAGGPTAQEGRIELCVQSSPGITIWGSVCNPQYYYYYSYGSASTYGVAEIVCRQLNYSRTGATLYSIAPFGPSQNPFVLDGASCSGTESSLLSCSSSYSVGVHHCHRGQESGVKCQAPCTSGSVHLVNGYTPTEGRLEMCISGSWTSFYAQNSWDTNAPNIACKQIFGNTSFGTAQFYGSPYYYQSYYGGGAGSLVVTQISCLGSEMRLEDCSYTTGAPYGHSYDVGICCYLSSSCTEGQVRLADGSTAYEGRVEVCHDRVWVAIYDSGWSYNNALVVCRQLGYPYQWAVPYGGSYFGKRTTLLELFNVYCSGNEASIGQCLYSSVSRLTNYNIRSQIGLTLNSISNNSAGVSCLGPSTNIPECSNGDVLLADGPSTREGRLKICKRDGFWASVCVNGVSKAAALILCRSLGINATGVTISSGKYHINTGPILSSISCTGSESHVKDCIFGNVGALDCGHDKDVVISCLSDYVSYDITVTTDPTNGPFTIGSTVALYCHSNPPLPPGVTYTWRAALYSSSLHSDSPQTSNATVTIGLNHPSIGHYYCVVNSGTSTLGVGKADISVQSLITSSLNPTIPFVPPQSIVLSVNVTEIDVTQYLRSLTWYHEGNPITAGGRVMISPDSTTLTIMNTVESDAGTYEVKHMGVVTSNRQEKCEARVLSSLRSYPILAGRKFTVTTQSVAQRRDQVETAQVVPLSGGSPLSLRLTWTPIPGPEYMWYYITNSYVSSVLYYNGQVGAPSGTRLSNVQLDGAYSAYQNFTIDLVCAQDSGYLDASLVIRTSDYLYYSIASANLYCPQEYYTFVSTTLGISTIELNSLLIKLTDTSTHGSISDTQISGAISGGVVGGLIICLLLVLIIILIFLVTKCNNRKTAKVPPTAPSMKYHAGSERIEKNRYEVERKNCKDTNDDGIYECTA